MQLTTKPEVAEAATVDERLIWSRSLDVFKGLAALAMVVNHGGYALLSSDAASNGATGFLVFLGSIAPAMFFFATGAGSGLRPADVAVDWAQLWRKAAWLFLADQFLIWAGGHRLGLDFFGFIALSMLIVAWVRSRAAPLLWCVGLIVALLIARYVAREFLFSMGEHGVLAKLVLGGLPGWSYPISPWLIAPLAGFWAARSLPQLSVRRRSISAAFTVMAGSMASVWLFLSGFSFFRWGTVAAGFVVAATTVTVMSWAVARLIVKAWPVLEAALSLRGASALLVVPVHYAVLALLTAIGFAQAFATPVSLGAILLIATLTLPASRQLARWLDARMASYPLAVWITVLIALGSVAWSPVGAMWVTLASCAAQVAIAIQFGRR